MTVSINYQKRKNNQLFVKLQSSKLTNLASVQNYIPIYTRFFSLNSNNWNSINLNHNWSISDIKENQKNESSNIFTCKLKHVSGDDDLVKNQKVFFKMAPLLDPFKYIIGKYNCNDPELFNLPTFEQTNKVHPKITGTNNASYVDGFFSFLSGQVLNQLNFIHGIDYYGSFLAIKNNYQFDVIDDIEYLTGSNFFNKQKGTIFSIEDYSHLIVDVDEKPLKPIKISNEISLRSNISIKSIDNNLFEGIFDDNVKTLDDIKSLGLDLVDITDSSQFDVSSQKKTETLKSGSSCSSRTSHTNNDELEEEEVNEDDYECDNSLSEDDESYETIDDNEKLMVTIPAFPVQVICMEQCESTFDDLIYNSELSEEEWFAALMQIIMILISYQKMFWFTHNDLHTNNIMYVKTNNKFIYYVYKKQIYKVPTFGRIYKIIDFGRAIYKFNGKIFCSDSFNKDGDAFTQYNTEPFFNEKKPRLDPNFSFDLCRLACSMFDCVVEDFDSIKNLESCSPLVKLVVEWCCDDNGVNLLYKNNGDERYPDFKLYKMIARCVHNHLPHSQLTRKEFSKYVVNHMPKVLSDYSINIDMLPVCV